MMTFLFGMISAMLTLLFGLALVARTNRQEAARLRQEVVRNRGRRA